MRIIQSTTKIQSERMLEQRFAAEYDPAVNYVVLVPDRRSLEWEKRLHASLGLEGSFNIEVCSFRRLAQKLLHSDNKTLSPEGAVMLMSKAIKNVKDCFGYFKMASVTDGFTRDVYSTVTAMRASDITPQRLESLCPTLSDALSRKTKDIAAIYKEYLTLLSGHSDGTTKLEALANLLKNPDFTYNASVWVVGFNTFNARQLDVLQGLLEKTGNLTVSLASLVPQGDNAKYYDTSAFFKLRKYSLDNGYSVETETGETCFSEEGKLIFDSLYSFDAPFCGKTGYFDYICASRLEEEVKSLAVLIRKLVLRGVRYKSIGVTLCDPVKYKPYIEKFFPLYDIPYHLDAPEKLDGHALIRFTLNCLTTAKNNFRREDVLELVKSPFVGAEYTKKCIFENYVLKKNINFKEFFSELDDEAAEEVRTCLVPILDASEKVFDSDTIAEATEALLDLYKVSDTENACLKLSEKEKEFDFLQEAEISAHIYQRITALLDDMTALLGDEQTTGTDFLNMFKDSIAQESMMLLPLSPDTVLFRTPENSDFESIDYLFVLGASQGAFPMESADSTIITLKDSACWLDGGIELKPTVKDDLKNQRFEILQLLSGRYEHITALYSKEGTENASASFIVKTLAKIFGAEQISSENIYSTFDVKDKEHFLALLGNKVNASFEMVEYGSFAYGKEERQNKLFDALYEYLKRNDLLIQSQVSSDQDELNLTKEELKSLYFGRGVIGVTGLERYFHCPFAFFLKNGLRLKDRELPDAKANDLGNIIHISLSEFFSKNKRDYFVSPTNEQADNALLKEVVSTTVNSVIEKSFAHYFKGKKGQFEKDDLIDETFNIVKKLLVYQNNTAFKTNPRYSEFSIEKIGLVAFKDDTTEIKYTGSIDRIDEWGEGKIVLDYKTGHVSGDFNEIYYGKKIQIYIYMKALLEDGTSIPAGVFYVPISAKYEKDSSKQDEETDEALTKGIFLGYYAKDQTEGVFDPEFVKKKSGGVSTQTMHNMIEYAHEVAQNALGEIMSGYIEKKPDDSGCKYCPFSDICSVYSQKKSRYTKGATVKLFKDESEK